jgi:SHS2 domain-containing protein
MRKNCKNNNKGFEIIEHLSDTGIKAWAGNTEELFEQCAHGMFSIICNTGQVKAVTKKTVEIKPEQTGGLEDLLILWLERLIYMHEVKKMLFSAFNVFYLKTADKTDQNGAGLRAHAFGERFDSFRHEIFTSIKAPTYHMLSVRKNAGSGLWEANVIFDV